MEPRTLLRDSSVVTLTSQGTKTIINPKWNLFGLYRMPTLTLKNIPDELYSRLKEAARLHHRSMNSEILFYVERALYSQPIDITERLTAARRLRSITRDFRLTDVEIERSKNEGRP